jgi:hypothetical protein
MDNSEKVERQRMSDGTLAKYADGGYPLFYVCADMGVLCPECATKSGQTDDPFDSQWYLVDVEPNYEDTALLCDHCGTRIPSAYAEEEAAREDYDERKAFEGCER